MDIQRLASTLSAAFMGDLADPMWVKDASHRYVSANKAFCGLCAFVSGDEGLAPGDIVDGTDFNLFPLEVAQAAQQDEAEVLRTRSHKRSDLVLFNLAGEPRRFQVLRIALFDDEGKVVGTLGHAIDITERTARRAQLRERERILSNVLGHMPAVAFQRQMDADWSMEYLSEGCLQLTGYEPARFIGNAVHSWGSLIEKDDYVTALQEVQNQLADDTQYSVQYRITLPDGELRWVSERGVGVAGKNGELENLVGVVFDFTETRHYLDEMVHRDTHDALTGVANRPVLIDHLRYGISYGERYKRMVATVVMNIDHFKYVNQSLGHDAGDELLVGVARRLRAAVRDHDTVARLGADSFALTLIEIENIGGAVQAMKRVLADVHKPFMLGEQEVVVTCSVGCALYPNDGLDPETLLRRADTAMRHARGLGGDCYYFYSAESDRATEERFYMEAQLRRAVDNGEILVHFQPQVAAGDGRLIGMEALVRWKHPDMGMVSPGRFIPVAEETDLIVNIGAYVMEESCRQIKALMDAGIPVGHVAVNLSARQFREENLVSRVAEVLQRTGLPARHLELEITESLAMNNVDAVVAKMKELKALGLQMAIDDFGTGYSSLSYLRRFPIDRLKIDQSFTREVTSSTDGAAIARAVIQLGHALDLKVIAEGVETEGQLGFLRENGCDEIQGYYYSRPLDPKALQELLVAGARDGAHFLSPSKK